MSQELKTVKAVKDWPYSLDGVKVKVLQKGDTTEVPTKLAQDGFGSGHVEIVSGKKAKKPSKQDEDKAQKPAKTEDDK